MADPSQKRIQIGAKSARWSTSKSHKDETEAEKADEKAKAAADTKEVQLSYLTVGLAIPILFQRPMLTCLYKV